MYISLYLYIVYFKQTSLSNDIQFFQTFFTFFCNRLLFKIIVVKDTCLFFVSPAPISNTFLRNTRQNSLLVSKEQCNKSHNTQETLMRTKHRRSKFKQKRGQLAETRVDPFPVPLFVFTTTDLPVREAFFFFQR